MGNKWSGRRCAAKDAEGKTQTSWNNNRTSTSLSQPAAVNDLSSLVSQPHDETDDQLANGITIYRSYSNVAPPEAEAEAELQPSFKLSSAGVRSDSLLLRWGWRQ